jgi:riboflavin kinase/FMN adenylyltransferase
MNVAYSLPSPSSHAAPCALTIGNFDGVHTGHQTLLKKTVQLGQQEAQKPAVFSFSNHPSTILKPGQPVLSLCTLEHKLRLLEAAGIEQLFLIPFTKELSCLSAEQFLRNLHAGIHFSNLILGYDAQLGKDRQGDRIAVETLSRQIGFQVFYLPEHAIDGEPVSSTRIRRHIQKGELDKASKLLGRPYSIYARVKKGAGRGKALGIHTANLSVEGLCLPPLGVYAVQLVHNGCSYPAVANLGIAPTFGTNKAPLLEVHVWDQELELYGELVEVLFHTYLRPEKQFETPEQLKAQIQQDIFQAQILLARKDKGE